MKKKSESSKMLTVIPGFGSHTLHVGQTEQEVKIVLGKPESRTRRYEGQYYYNYPSKGIEVDFGDRMSGVKFIFYFRGGVRGNRQAKVVTDSGIKLGDTRQRVLAVMGEPEEKGKPAVLNSGTRFGEWFSYRTGINFQFGDDGCVDMITIRSAASSGDDI